MYDPLSASLYKEAGFRTGAKKVVDTVADKATAATNFAKTQGGKAKNFAKAQGGRAWSGTKSLAKNKKVQAGTGIAAAGGAGYYTGKQAGLVDASGRAIAKPGRLAAAGGAVKRQGRRAWEGTKRVAKNKKVQLGAGGATAAGAGYYTGKQAGLVDASGRAIAKPGRLAAAGGAVKRQGRRAWEGTKRVAKNKKVQLGAGGAAAGGAGYYTGKQAAVINLFNSSFFEDVDE